MKKSNWSSVVPILLIVILGFVFNILAAYPGFMSPDSLDQYVQAKTNVYTDSHPPMMAWIWNKLLWIKDGPQPMLLLNNLLYWSGVGIVATKIKYFRASLIFLILSFSVPLINFIGVVYKDTLLFSLLFFQCSLLFYIYDLQFTKAKRVLLMCAFLLVNLVAVMLIDNAAAAVAPLLCLVLIIFLDRLQLRYIILVSSVTIVVLFGIGRYFNRILYNNKSTHPKQQMMVYDLMAVSYSKKQNVLPDYLKNKLPLDTINKYYTCSDGGSYARYSINCVAENEAQWDSLKQCWVKELIENPTIVLKHKYSVFKCLQKQPTITTYIYIHPNNLGFALKEPNVVKTIFVQYIQSEYAQVFYKGVIYFVGCCVIFLLAFLWYYFSKNKSALLPLFISLSGLLYAFSYSLLSPTTDFKYHYWSIGAMFLSGTLLLYLFLPPLPSIPRNTANVLAKVRLILIMLFVIALPFDMLYSTIVLLLLIVSTLLSLKTIKLYEIPKQVWIFQIVFFLSVIGYFYSTDVGRAGYLIQRQLAIFLFPIILPLAIKIDKKHTDLIVKSLVLSCFATILFLFSVCFKTMLTERLPLHDLFTVRFLNHQFAGPVGIHAGYLSLYVSLSVLYISCKLTTILSVRNRFFYVVILGILVAGLLFLESRNIIIGTVFVLLFLFPFYYIKHKARYLVICITGLVLLITVAKKSTYIKDRFSSELIGDIDSNIKSHSEEAFSEPRILRWQCAVRLIKKAPVWGYGTGDEQVMLNGEYLKNNLPVSYQYNLDAHSTYLSYLLKHGFVGLIVFIAMFIYFIVLAVKSSDFLYTAFLIILLVGFFTENILDVNKGIFYFGLFNTLFGYRILFARRSLKAATPTIDL